MADVQFADTALRWCLKPPSTDKDDRLSKSNSFEQTTIRSLFIKTNALGSIPPGAKDDFDAQCSAVC